jgi:lipoprotein Spr
MISFRILVWIASLLLINITAKSMPTDTASRYNAANFEQIAQFFEKHYRFTLNSADPLPLYAFVKDWHWTPYRYAGLTRRGLDCSGLVGVAAREVFDVELSRGAGNIYKECAPVRKQDLQPGDLVFFRIGTSFISHVGMYLKDGLFVHAAIRGGVIISSLDEPYYRRYYFAGGRHTAIARQVGTLPALPALATTDALTIGEVLRAEACAAKPEALQYSEATYLNQSATSRAQQAIYQSEKMARVCAVEYSAQRKHIIQFAGPVFSTTTR